MDVGDADGHGRGGTGDDVALPERALLLHAAQGLVHVGDVHARTQVLVGELLEAAAVGARHLGGVAARGRGRDQLDQRAVVDRRLELVEGLADVEEQPQVDAELGDRLERAQPGLADEGVRTLDEARQFLRVEALRQRVSVVGFLGRRERRPVPGRVAGTVAELAEHRRLDERGCSAGAIGRERDDRRVVEPGRRGRRRRQQRQARELAECVEHRDPERRVAAGEGAAIVEQHLAEAHERVVDVADLGPVGLLVAADREHEVASQGARRHGGSGQADLAEPVGDALEAGAARAHDEHALVLADEGAEGVHDGLGAAGARQRLHDEGVAGGDLRDDVLLLGIGVEQQHVGGRRTRVLAHGLHGVVGALDALARGGVAGDGVDDGVVELGGIRRSSVDRRRRTTRPRGAERR